MSMKVSGLRLKLQKRRKNVWPALLSLPAMLPAAHAADADSQDSDVLETVIVLGNGETRQVQSVSASQIEQLPPGTSPLKAIEKLPGVNFQSADPFGSYEWSTRITVRGFDQNRLGFTLDRVPLGDMTYGNHNGLHVSRAIPSELVSKVELSQGTGSLDTASSSNLGGTVKFFSLAPSEEFGARVQQMFGSDSARRTFAQLDSGSFGSGTRGYIAVVDSTIEKWKGGGNQDQRVYTLKIVQPMGSASLTAYYNKSDRAEIDYQDLSYDIVRRRGWDWDNWYPNWGAAVAAADICAASGGNDAVACDDAYWNAAGLRKDDLAYLAFAVPFGDTFKWDATIYRHKDEGQGLWGTPYVPSPGGAPLSIRATEYDLDRKGIVTALTWTMDGFDLNGGVWYETNDFTQARRFYDEPSRLSPTRDFMKMQRNPFRTDWEYDFDTTTLIFHLQGMWSINDAFRLNGGFRSVKSENEALTVVGPLKTGTLETKKPFLPQVGVSFDITDELEWFASAAKNVRTFASSGTSGPFSTTAAGFAAIRDVIKPETSTNVESGLRFRGRTLYGLIAVYHVDFKDRLLGITQGPGIVGNPPVLANVGGVKTKGIEAALNWRMTSSFNWFTSVAWNDSRYDDDYTRTSDTGVVTVVPVSGKQVVDTPKWLVKSELSFDTGSFFVRGDVNYTDKRYYTYLNEGGVDSYALLNASLGYRFTDLGAVKELAFQLDATNLTDKKYFSTIGSNGFKERDPAGTAQTLLRGAPRQFFATAKVRF
jgi:iron complex outermembrane receptor protein